MFRNLSSVACLFLLVVGTSLGQEGTPKTSSPEKDLVELDRQIAIKAQELADLRTKAEALRSSLVKSNTASDKSHSVQLSESVKLEFVRIPAGTFSMGTGTFLLGNNGGADDEMFRHSVKITKDYYLGKYEVTQEQWLALMDKNPSAFKGDKLPVDTVTWAQSQDFLKKLNEKLGPKAGKFRLPTEAEWEYACRAETTTRWSFGDEEEEILEHGWNVGNSQKTTHAVGGKKPNPWGLYDMHGNVLEWCSNAYDSNDYNRGAQTDPKGPVVDHAGASHRTRGGDWSCNGYWCRSAARHLTRDQDVGEGYSKGRYGFRVVLEVPQDAPPPSFGSSEAPLKKTSAVPRTPSRVPFRPAPRVPAAVAGLPKSLPENVRLAWVAKSAYNGWFSGDEFASEFRTIPQNAFDPGPGKVGEIPGFHWFGWKPGAAAKVPAPDQPFGLKFSGIQIDDAGLKELAVFENLQTLHLFETKVTDAGLKELAPLKKLQMLDLSALPITDAGLKELTNCAELNTLVLYKTAVTDAGLQHLAACKQLRLLHLGETKVTDAGVKELQAALPKLKISR